MYIYVYMYICVCVSRLHFWCCFGIVFCPTHKVYLSETQSFCLKKSISKTAWRNYLDVVLESHKKMRLGLLIKCRNQLHVFEILLYYIFEKEELQTHFEQNGTT